MKRPYPPHPRSTRNDIGRRKSDIQGSLSHFLVCISLIANPRSLPRERRAKKKKNLPSSTTHAGRRLIGETAGHLSPYLLLSPLHHENPKLLPSKLNRAIVFPHPKRGIFPLPEASRNVNRARTKNFETFAATRRGGGGRRQCGLALRCVSKPPIACVS